MILATYNVHFGLGRDGAYDIGRIARELRSADIVCLQEVVQGWPQNGFADQAAEIAGLLDMHWFFHGPLDADASDRGADGKVRNRRRTFGNAVLSRWPILTALGHLLPKRALPRSFDLQRGFVEATIATPDGALRVYSVHLSHLTAHQRAPQVEALLAAVTDAAARGPAWDGAANPGFVFSERAPAVPEDAVVMGDFNFRPLDPEYAMVCGELAWNSEKRVVAHGQLFDAWTCAGKDPEEGESFPDEGRIDHCFVTAGLVDAVKGASIDTTAEGSDHWPVFVELDLGARQT